MDPSPSQGGASPSSLAELDALLDDPARWSSIDPDKLRHLVFYRCLSYGLQPDDSLIPSLMGLHRVAVERLHPSVRRQVVVHLARAIERVHREHELREGAGCTNALLPFLLEDPDPSVVSSAALEMALLLPLDGNDVLTGPRYLRSLSPQLGSEDAKAGLIAGLLQLGDLRVAPLVEGAWEELGVEGRQTLALLIQGFHGLNGLTVRFLVSWLEHEVREPASATFGMVAATLARAGRHAAEHGIDEFDRVFPVSDAVESLPNPVRHATLDEYRRSIEERLVRAGWAETPPRIMPHVLSYWELAEEAYRLAAATAVGTFLAAAEGPTGSRPPVSLDLVPDWPEETEKETVLEWGIFNPIGPTINTLRVTPIPGATALVYTLYHPGGSESRVMAVLGTSHLPSELAATVIRVMAANGGHAVWMLRSLPDYVYVPAASRLERRDVAEAIGAARAAAEAAGDERLDLGWHARRLAELARDPWATANREIDEASRGEATGGDDEPAKAGKVRLEVVAPDVDAYVRWLDVAADRRHVEAVRSRIPVAWQRLVDTPDDDEQP